MSETMNADRRARLARLCAVRALVTETSASMMLASLDAPAPTTPRSRSDVPRRVAPKLAARSAAHGVHPAPPDADRGPRA